MSPILLLQKHRMLTSVAQGHLDVGDSIWESSLWWKHPRREALCLPWRDFADVILGCPAVRRKLSDEKKKNKKTM